MAFICAVVDPFPFEIDRMCSDFTCATSEARIATSVFQCSGSTSADLPALLSMSEFNLQQVLMKTFVMMGRIHFSHTLSHCPHIVQSGCQIRAWISLNKPHMLCIISSQHWQHLSNACQQTNILRRIIFFYMPGQRGEKIQAHPRHSRCLGRRLRVSAHVPLDAGMNTKHLKNDSHDMKHAPNARHAEMAMLTSVQTFEQSLSLIPRLAFPSCCGIQVFCILLDVAAEDGLHWAKWLPLRVQFHMSLHAGGPASLSFWWRLRTFTHTIVVSLRVLRVWVGRVPSATQTTYSYSLRLIYIHILWPMTEDHKKYIQCLSAIRPRISFLKPWRHRAQQWIWYSCSQQVHVRFNLKARAAWALPESLISYLHVYMNCHS